MSDRAPARLKIGALMEMISILAVGAGFARGYHSILTERRLVLPLGSAGLIRAVGGAGLVGAALAGGLALLWESRSKSEPRVRARGFGRWIWGVTALVVVLTAAMKSVSLALFRTFTSRTTPLSAAAVADSFVGAVPGILVDDYPFAVAAMAIVAYFTKSLSDPAPDLREWSGRVLASVIVGLGTAVPIMRAFGL